MCIRNRDYPADLTLFRVYRARTSEALARRGILSVIDDSGESYLFDADYFVPVELPAESARAFVELAERLDREWAEHIATLGPEGEEDAAEQEEQEKAEK